jgi:hypothetical protein
MSRKATLREAATVITRAISQLRARGIDIPQALLQTEQIISKHNEAVTAASNARISSVRGG